MLKTAEVRRQIAQKLRELLSKAKNWDERADEKIGGQHADLVVRFTLGERDYTLVVVVSSLGQPRQIRAAVTRLAELRRALAGVHPVAAASYIGPQSARILKSNNLGYVDLAGNCLLAFDSVLIEKEGKRNLRPSTRPLRSLFAPRATRVVRVLLVEPARAWRLEELAHAAQVSLGHSHNVIKRLEELAWAERDATQRIRLAKPADLLDAWCDSYSWRANGITSYLAPERPTRRFMADAARAALGLGRRYAFTLNAGASLVAPRVRIPIIHCYLEGDPGPFAQALGLRPSSEADGTVHVLEPYDPGVFYGVLEKGGLAVVCLPQLYADLLHWERRGAEQAEHLRREAMGY